MSGAWDDEQPVRQQSFVDEPSTTFVPKPRSQQMQQQQAAVLHALLPTPAGYAQALGVSGDASGSWESHSEQPAVNALSAQMSLMMSRPGGGGKLKLLRRDAPAQSQASRAAQADGDSADPANRQEREAKTAEQRQREYEETRAAIFSGHVDLEGSISSSPVLSTGGSPAPMGTAQRIGTRQGVDASPEGTGQQAAAPNSSASPSPDAEDDGSSIQPTAAAIAVVSAHHSKRSTKQAELQDKRSRGGAQAQGGSRGGSQRIIDDIVGNRSSARNSDGGYADPDFDRSSRGRGRRGQQQQQGYGYMQPQQQQPMMYGYAMPPPAVAAAQYGYGMGVPIGPGQSHYALGPQANSIGFGRGQPVAANAAYASYRPHVNNASGGSGSGLNPNSAVFNPNAPSFYPITAPPAQYPYTADPYNLHTPSPSSLPAAHPPAPGNLSAYPPLGGGQRQTSPPAAQSTPPPQELQPMIRIVPASVRHLHATPNVYQGNGTGSAAASTYSAQQQPAQP